MKTVEGRTVLVTGAAIGMGRLYAQRAVAEKAASVVLWDVDGPGLARTREELAAGGARIHAHTVDLASPPDIRTAAARVRAEAGEPDIVINNAGIVHDGWFWEQSPARVDATLRVNALGPMHVALEFLPGMIERGVPARLLNITSASGLVPVPRMAAYTASKWAATGWSDTLRLELERAGHAHVRVTTLVPSYIDTGMFAGARAPLLTPVLEPGYVVDRAWEAMKQGRPVLMLPWSVRLSMLLRGLLPRRAWDALAGGPLGVYGSMEDFTGRTGRGAG